MVMGAIVHGVYPFCSSVGSMFIHQLPWSFRQPIGNDLPNKICQVGTHCWLKKTLDVHHVTVWLWVLILSSRGCFLWRIAKTRFPCKTLDRGDQALQRYILCQTATRHLYYLDAKCLRCQVFAIFFNKIYRRRKRIVLMISFPTTHHQWWYPFHHIIYFLLLSRHRFRAYIPSTQHLCSEYSFGGMGEIAQEVANIKVRPIDRKPWYFSL